MDDPGSGARTHLSWANVGLAFLFVAFDAGVSQSLGLGVGLPLITAATRCIIQLTLMSLVLAKVFEAESPWGVAALAVLLNILGAAEVNVNKAKFRFAHMFPITLFSMLCGTIPVAVVGAKLAMAVEPVWKPDQFIPVVGMLCGATVSAVIIVLNYVLKEIYENRDKVETYLAFGATRFEACQPVAKEALRLALTPPINQMSVLGIIAIPGMMTGAILGGASVQQAARLQMVIMFMIAAAGALASILVTVLTLGVVVDTDHRVRAERIDSRPHWVWRGRSALGKKLGVLLEAGADKVKGVFRRKEAVGEEGTTNGERDGLLGVIASYGRDLGASKKLLDKFKNTKMYDTTKAVEQSAFDLF